MRSLFRHRRNQRPLSRLQRALLTITVVACVSLFVGLVVRLVREHDALIQWRQTLNAHGAGPRWPVWDNSWPALRDPRRVRGAGLRDLRGPYAYAAVNPEILKQIPCYCGCARLGHRSNLDCYIRGRTTDGKPIWDDHTFTCPMCADITREVALMLQSGSPIAAAKQAIETVYGARYGTGTATPTGQIQHEHEPR